MLASVVLWVVVDIVQGELNRRIYSYKGDRRKTKRFSAGSGSIKIKYHIGNMVAVGVFQKACCAWELLGSREGLPLQDHNNGASSI